MDNNQLLKKLLYLYDNLTFDVSLTEKKVSFVMKKDKTLGEKLDYQEFADIFLSAFKIVPSAKEKLIRFMNNLNPANMPFDLPVEYISDTGSPVRVNYRGYKYNDTNVLFVVSISDDSHNGELDPLTKCYSKNFIIEKIKEAIDDNKEFTLMILDIDNFKLFNDNYGHMFGDIVLVEAVAAINSVLKDDGYIARIGGDEFLVMYYVPNSYSRIYGACKLIRDSITELSKNNVKNSEITATLGASSYPIDGKDYETLFKKADKALYRGKKKGRNCFIIYDEEKCGSIDQDDAKEKAMDRLFTSTTNYNIIAGVLEILNRNYSLKKNLTDALSLVGSYFLLDRVILSNQNPDTLENLHEIIWYQPRSKRYPAKIPTNDEKAIWNRTLDKTGMLKLVQVHANQNLEVYPILKRDNTTAILAFELAGDNKIFGLIRYEMCSINKFWQQQDVSALMLIAKMFSIKLNKEYQENKHIKELYYDKLTDLYSYTKWRNEVNDYLSINPDSYYSVLDFNISGFRSLNEVLGTKACDEILMLIGGALKKLKNVNLISARETDDKFLIFIPRHDKEELEGTMDFISSYVKDNNQTKKQIILNSGVYFASPDDDLSIAIDKANIARKNCKKSQEISYFNSEMDYLEKEKLIMELHMHDAKEKGEFLLYLQPKFDTEKNELVGAEALTRWNYNFKQILTPNIFIPLFEQNGFITELDYQVFENVCKFQKSILDEGKTPVIISVNVSRYQSNFDEYIETIESIRNKYKIPSSLIEIEITEGMYNNNQVNISEFMKKLHSRGYFVSMDDFGAGYSNLSNLALLDFDIIKLDKSFCNNQDNKREAIVLSFVMQLAKQLNIQVLCEGVETQAFCDYLKTIGCTLVQGYLYDKPMPSEQFKEKYYQK